MPEPQRIVSRDNALLAKLRKLAHDTNAYRKLGHVWLEGEHLCDAVRRRSIKPVQAVIAESAWDDPALRALAQWAPKISLVADTLIKGISTLESPPRIGYLLQHPPMAMPRTGVATVVLDRLQDAGNVGSILRSASALGVAQVIALKGTAALWSTKVLRAGMGAHFGLHLIEGFTADELTLDVPLLATSSHAAQALPEVKLPRPCAWVFGHEGQGVEPALLVRCAFTVRIPQPGGEESLNVAAAAAICLYASSNQ